MPGDNDKTDEKPPLSPRAAPEVISSPFLPVDSGTPPSPTNSTAASASSMGARPRVAEGPEAYPPSEPTPTHSDAKKPSKGSSDAARPAGAPADDLLRLRDTVSTRTRLGHSVSVRTVEMSYANGSRSVITATTDAATRKLAVVATQYPCPMHPKGGAEIDHPSRDAPGAGDSHVAGRAAPEVYPPTPRQAPSDDIHPEGRLMSSTPETVPPIKHLPETVPPIECLPAVGENCCLAPHDGTNDEARRMRRNRRTARKKAAASRTSPPASRTSAPALTPSPNNDGSCRDVEATRSANDATETATDSTESAANAEPIGTSSENTTMTGSGDVVDDIIENIEAGSAPRRSSTNADDEDQGGSPLSDAMTPLPAFVATSNNDGTRRVQDEEIVRRRLLENAVEGQVVPSNTKDSVRWNKRAFEYLKHHPRRASAALLMFVVLTVGVILMAAYVPRSSSAESHRTTENSNNSIDNNNETTTTPHPNPQPDPDPVVVRSDAIKSILLSISTNETLSDELSPQGRAFFWIAHEDELQLPYHTEEDVRHLIQRYILACIYYSTGGGDGYWIQDYHFLEGIHECHW